MDLFKWTKNLKPNFPNVIEKFLGSKIEDHADDSEAIATVPLVNISERDTAFDVSIAIPGMDKKDIKLEFNDNCLIISSEKEYENEESDSHWMRKEYGYSSFQRMFQLPENADSEKVDANLKNGVLRIKVGKKIGMSSNRKQIKVR